MQLPLVSKAAKQAWPLVVAEKRPRSAIGSLGEIVFVVVSDARIARIHAEFMDDASATDVITFRHGEIVLSAETARRESSARKIPLWQEISRYAIHGLLHLAGWDDCERESAFAMRRVQEKILRSAFRGVC